MSMIEQVAKQLEDIYSEEGPASKGHVSLGDAEEAIAIAQGALSEVGTGSEQSELSEAADLHKAALEKIEEAREALGKAVLGAIALRNRILGEAVGGGNIAKPTTEEASSQPSQPKRSPRLKVRTVHLTPTGVHFKKHPDPGMQADAERLAIDKAIEEELFRNFVDNAPNHNDEYTDEIEFVRQFYADQGVAIAPIVTLDDERFERAGQLRGESVEDLRHQRGFVAGGRIIVRTAPTGLVRELFGTNTYLGTLIHEGGHSEGNHEGDLFVMSSQQGDEATTVVRCNYGGFIRVVIKNNHGEPELSTEGHFFDEGAADLRRVEGLRAAGKESDIDTTLALEGGRILMGSKEKITLPSTSDPKLEIPARFAVAAKTLPDGQSGVIQSPAMLASYGLELIAQEVPGFRETLNQAQRDPAMQAELVKAVDGLEPGLYRALRKLPYTDEGFEQGLRLIGQAIRDRR